MATCPDCGSLIMEGDPYCTHCGAHLVWSYDDDDRQKHRREREPEMPKTDEEKVEDIIRDMFLPPYKAAILKSKVMSYLNAKDCNALEVRSMNGGYIFAFTRQNKYIKTTDEFDYDPEYDNLRRVFWDCYTNHNHDGLLNDSEFKRLIESVGLEFVGCYGGYVSEYDHINDELKMIDEIDVRVKFKAGEKKYRSYRLDLERMKLDDDYFESTE